MTHYNNHSCCPSSASLNFGSNLLALTLLRPLLKMSRAMSATRVHSVSDHVSPNIASIFATVASFFGEMDSFAPLALRLPHPLTIVAQVFAPTEYRLSRPTRGSSSV